MNQRRSGKCPTRVEEHLSKIYISFEFESTKGINIIQKYWVRSIIMRSL